MKTESWMTRSVQTCRPDTSMNEAAHLMWAGDFGVLPVIDGDGCVVGMITDRDMCMGAYFLGKPLGDMRVADSMAHDVLTCHESDPVEQVIRQMGQHRVRRVPVLDRNERLVGVLSINDIARRLVSLSERERGRLAPRFVEALAAICEARVCALPEVAPARRVAVTEPSMVG